MEQWMINRDNIFSHITLQKPLAVEFCRLTEQTAIKSFVFLGLQYWKVHLSNTNINYH